MRASAPFFLTTNPLSTNPNLGIERYSCSCIYSCCFLLADRVLLLLSTSLIVLLYCRTTQFDPARSQDVCPEADRKGGHSVDRFMLESRDSDDVQELAEVTSNPPAGMTIGLVDESNVHNWDITMDGPEGSPYVV